MANVIEFNEKLISDLERTNYESFCAVMNHKRLTKMIIDSDDRLNVDWK